jgi:hypothetical protein
LSVASSIKNNVLIRIEAGKVLMRMDPRSALASAVIVFFVAAQCRADVLAANNFPEGLQSTNGWAEVGVILPSLNYVYDNVRRGQSFIAHSSGNVTRLDTLLAAGLGHLVPQSPLLDVSIYESNDGIPGTKLGTVSYAAPDFFAVFESEDHRVTVDFSSLAIAIHAGEEYLVAYESPFGVVGTDSSDAPYFVGLVLDNPIPFNRGLSAAYNGVDWEMTHPIPPFTFELATRVWVIPEPTSELFLVVAAMALASPSSSRRFAKRSSF